MTYVSRCRPFGQIGVILAMFRMPSRIRPGDHGPSPAWRCRCGKTGLHRAARLRQVQVRRDWHPPFRDRTGRRILMDLRDPAGPRAGRWPGDGRKETRAAKPSIPNHSRLSKTGPCTLAGICRGMSTIRAASEAPSPRPISTCRIRFSAWLLRVGSVSMVSMP